ncbi:hypothetical protein BDV06DRAFT_222784 [Aspergillus oleicola]
MGFRNSKKLSLLLRALAWSPLILLASLAIVSPSGTHAQNADGARFIGGLVSDSHQILSYFTTPSISGSNATNLEIEYLTRSIQVELSRRLSQTAQVFIAGEEGFNDVNARYTDYQRPQYIVGVKPKIEQDVVETVNYARMRGISFAARAGGHALTTSLRRIRNAIVIDMTDLNQISYDSEKQRVTIGGGTLTGQFANATHSYGMEVTVGSCPCTGVIGISMGAGIGRLQGRYGYLHDNMVSIKLLLANGTIIQASKDINPDVFWAVRGAGHNFGIGLEAVYKVYPQRNEGIHYVVDFEYDLGQTESVFETLNDIASPMPPDIAFFVIGRQKGKNGKPTININLVYAGPPSEAQTFVKKFESVGPVWQHEKTVSWDSLPWATYNGMNNVLCTSQGWAKFPLKQFIAANVQKYDIRTVTAFVRSWASMIEKYGSQSLFTFMFESFAQQTVRERSHDSTAYPWRHASDHFLMMEAANRKYDPELESIYDAWLSEQQGSFIRTAGYGENEGGNHGGDGQLRQYVNYGHGSKDPAEALYGYESWRLESLRQLKEDLDPEGLFNGYQPFIEGLED